MPSWMPFFVIVAALAIVLQAVILAVMAVEVRRIGRQVEKVTNDLNGRITPLIARIQVIVEDAQPRIDSLLSDAAEISHAARGQVQRADRVLTEAMERLRMQLVHADQILTGALEVVESTGTKIRRTVWGPVQSVSAIIRGIQVGLEMYRGRRQGVDGVGTSSEQQQDETLFI